MNINFHTNNPGKITVTINGEIEIDRYQLQIILSQLIQLRPAIIKEKSAQEEAIPTNRLLFTVEEAARMLAVSQKTIYRLIDRGILKTNGTLRHIRIPRKEIERYLARSS